MKSTLHVAFSLSVALLTVAACGDDDTGGPGGGAGTGNGGSAGRPPEQTGAYCEVDDDCFPDVAEDALQGDALCLTAVRDGYCTHTCTTDDDCCAATGECKTDLPQVCSPFQSEDGMMCFLSCEDEDVDRVDDVEDEQAFCQRYASSDFICRSSGGGSNNRKICVPGDCGIGADCSTTDDCAADLECFTTYRGGYCGLAGCLLNDDCPGDALCVVSDDGNNYCQKPCTAASDCTLCRHDGLNAVCSDDVTFAEADASGSVCLPVAP